MVDPFKLPACTAYSPRQNFSFVPNYLKGVCSFRPSDITNAPVTGESGMFNIQKSEKVVKGFSEGTVLKQAPLFPDPQPVASPARPLKKPPKTARKVYPQNRAQRPEDY